MAAVFVLPVDATGQRGPVAAMTSAAGWAAAAERVLGQAWIVAPAGILAPGEARQVGSAAHLAQVDDTSWRRHVPVVVKTAMKDVRQWRRGRHFTVPTDGPWVGQPIDFVWQRHELFHTAGADLAHRLGAPLVLFVPATTVWEARQWGVRRPGWGGALERLGERPSFLAAQVIACGSEAVAEQAIRIGAPAERVLVTPTGVDLDLFDGTADRAAVRQRYGLDGFVVGWTGSFRRFHALEQAVEAVALVPGATLLMVGDGPERPALERLAAERGVRAVFTGTVDHADLPAHLAAMDAALVLAPADGSFHYSPLKLAEYLAAGLPVVAPKVGNLAERLHDGTDALLVPPGNPAATAAALTRLSNDETLRQHLSTAARTAAQQAWTWDHQIQRVLTALNER